MFAATIVKAAIDVSGPLRVDILSQHLDADPHRKAST